MLRRFRRTAGSEQQNIQVLRQALTAADLIVPVYLDSNTLLDLLGSIEGGFSVVEKITTRGAVSETTEKGVHAEAGTEFGILNVLSLLKISLGGSISRKAGHETGEEREVERYHTYGSLLSRLRRNLIDQGLLKTLDSEQAWESLEFADFVEIRGVFRPNPMRDYFESFERLLGFYQMLWGSSFVAQARQKAAKGTPQSPGQDSQIKQFRQFAKQIVTELETGESRLVVVDVVGPSAGKAVFLLFPDYLRDRSMKELAHHEFRVLGKVLAKVSDDSQPIDLLMGTALGGVPEEQVEALVSVLNEIEGVKLPRVETIIQAPAVQIVPVAIYA